MSFASMLNKICDIEAETLATDDSGQQIQTWRLLYGQVPCRLRARAVSERRYGPASHQKATHALYLGAKKFPRGAMLRVGIEGVYYDVAGRINLGGDERFLCLYVERCE